MMSHPYTVVLCGDANYKRQILTTLKSICAHNRNLQFYLLNQDIEPEWIEDLNHNMKKYDCDIQDIKILNKDFEGFRTYSHISPATYLRYFISEKINEDKILYLDSDLIVRGDLTSLFEIELGECALAAAWDMISDYEEAYIPEFNAGVLLINNKAWKAAKVLKNAMEIHEKEDDKLQNADQTVLNRLFQDKWLPLPPVYNLQVGVDFIRKIKGDKVSPIEEKNPRIVHFTTVNKPWNHKFLGVRSRIRLRKLLSLKELCLGRVEVPFEKEWRLYDRAKTL